MTETKNSCVFKRAYDKRAIKVQYHGATYPTLKRFCQELGISQERLRSRLRRGMDLEMAVDAPPLNCTIMKDHHGNIFPSLTALAEHYHMSYNCLRSRLYEMNMTVEQALTLPYGSSLKRRCFDHEGNAFATAAERAAFWKKDPKQVEARLRHGWTVKRALTEPTLKPGRPRKEK